LQIIESLEGSNTVLKLSGRNPRDFEYIEALPELGDLGIILIDDFHRLSDLTKFRIADFIKLLADTENTKSKVIIVGINKAGQSLINYASDLTGRIDTIPFESNPDEKVIELIEKGEAALKISINIKADIVRESQGSFHLAQILCHDTCVDAGILEEKEEQQVLTSSIEVIRERVLSDLAKSFFEKAKLFATGPRLRREGRAPYFYLLHWLASGKEWSINVRDTVRQKPEHRGSVGQIVEKGFLADHIQKNVSLQDVIHYDPETTELSVEDPKFVFYLRNLLWSKFGEKIGYKSVEFDTRYDYALSFAGSDREIAEMLFEYLTEHEISVFYDKNEQHRILAENVEDYLAPIYKSEAAFVIVLLGREYPKRIWAKFESDQFKDRFGEKAVIPVWFSDVPPGMFDETSKVGGITFDVSLSKDQEIDQIGGMLCRKLEVYKEESNKTLEIPSNFGNT
ncbi:MAG: TIR domain-containing protein, partial [Nitrosomonas sp.]|nr:TIR domain-containing protein [Nitrosomonas sp.]